jgi:hypothetical protein
MLNIFSPGTPLGQDPPLQHILTGGTPPPPPPAAGAALAIEDRDDRIAIPTPNPTPATPLPKAGAPLAIRNRPMKRIKKPPLKPKVKPIPPIIPPDPIIVDPPPSKRPRKAEKPNKRDEILRILDGITDSEPRRVKKLISELPVPSRNRLRLMPA